MRIFQEIKKELLQFKDDKYQKFNSRLIPSIDSKTILGVRTPYLRAIAKKFSKHKDVESFLRNVPHKYFEENQIHIFIISKIKDYNTCIAEINHFLPYIDNWATCDQLRPTIFDKKDYREKLLNDIKLWLKGVPNSITTKDNTYTIRFGIEMLMTFFLGENFKPTYVKWVCQIKSKEYYLNMMIAWFLATALSKNYSETLPFIKSNKLDDWTHNKAIQKAIKSHIVTLDQKEYLKTLKR